jgi:hypothetical protein
VNEDQIQAGNGKLIEIRKKINQIKKQQHGYLQS